MKRRARTGDASYFETAYRSYEDQNPPGKLDHYLDMLTARLVVKRPRLLDVGCGRGAFLHRASARFPEWDLSGTDLDPTGVEATAARVPTANVQLSGADETPFEASSFDVITAWDVLEHVPDLPEAIRAIKTMLRPAGLLAFVVPVYDGITAPVIRRLDRDPTHLHKRSRDFWVETARSQFGSVEWHGIYRYLLTRRIYIHRPTRRLRNQTAAIFVSAIRF
jgi:SAM-dependent methyltransferase